MFAARGEISYHSSSRRAPTSALKQSAQAWSWFSRAATKSRFLPATARRKAGSFEPRGNKMREAHNFYEAQLETSPAQNLRPRAGHALPQNKITRAQPRFIRAAKKKSARAWCGFVVVFPNRQNYNFPSCSSLEARLVLNSSREGAKRMGFHIFLRGAARGEPSTILSISSRPRAATEKTSEPSD